MMSQFFKFSFIFILLLPLNIAFANPNFVFEIHGTNEAQTGNIKIQLNALVSEHKGSFSPALARKIYSQSIKEVKKSLEPYGFFRAQVSANLMRTPTGWQATYFVTLGEPLRITHINASISGPGQDNLKLQKFIEKRLLKEGDIFNVPDYDDFKTDLFQKAKNQGYLRAAFKNKIVVDLRNYTCFIEINLETGPQFYFGNITFETHPYSENFMRRFISLKPGQVFSSDKIIKLQQAMERSYYFKRVIFKPDFKNTQDEMVPINASLYPPPEISYNLGVGYGTFTGPRLSSSADFRHIGNEGHHIKSNIKLSSILTEIKGFYYMPGKDPLTEEWGVGATYKIFAPKAGMSHSFTLTGGYTKKFHELQTAINLNYLVDKFSIYGLQPERFSHELYPRFQLNYTHVDNLVNPNNGIVITLNALGASKEALSTTSFIQGKTRFKFIASPFSFSRIIFRADAGATAVSNLPAFPLSLRFFAGGINSIRGFADSSIGPGKYLVVGSLEYQQRISGNWYAALFYDAGNAANNFGGPYNRGAGVGIVYDTPVGPLKIYGAQALSKRTKPKSIEFSIGPEIS